MHGGSTKRCAVQGVACQHDSMVAGALVRELPGGGMEFVLEERSLSFIRIDHRTRLQFGPTEVAVTTPFTVESQGVVHRLDPHLRAGLGPLLAVFPGAARWLWTTARGELTVAFESGTKIVVAPDPVIDAWSVGSPHTSQGYPPR